ncbi:MAG TPA: Mov34/MPN/PAD-1 family protein, partial [Anaerolineae bacterium]|nr:Mov34/MPN/PAD-1 family protein [Anaerolineae bacterium]
MRISKQLLERIADHAAATYPDECCGLLVGQGDEVLAVEATRNAFAAESGGSFLMTNDPVEAVTGADFIYTDCWWWTGQEDEYKDRVAAFQAFQVNPDLWSHAKPEAKFMHCLPAMRGEEVVDEIADGPMSIIFPQAQN